jgi:hypothetical protein
MPVELRGVDFTSQTHPQEWGKRIFFILFLVRDARAFSLKAEFDTEKEFARIVVNYTSSCFVEEINLNYHELVPR